jgi:hypothetical protein
MNSRKKLFVPLIAILLALTSAFAFVVTESTSVMPKAANAGSTPVVGTTPPAHQAELMSTNLPPRWPDVGNTGKYSFAAYVCAVTHNLAANAFFSPYDDQYGFEFPNLRSCVDWDMAAQEHNSLGRIAYIRDLYEWYSLPSYWLHQEENFTDWYVAVLSSMLSSVFQYGAAAVCAMLTAGLSEIAAFVAGAACDKVASWYEVEYGINQD